MTKWRALTPLAPEEAPSGARPLLRWGTSGLSGITEMSSSCSFWRLGARGPDWADGVPGMSPGLLLVSSSSVPSEEYRRRWRAATSSCCCCCLNLAIRALIQRGSGGSAGRIQFLILILAFVFVPFVVILSFTAPRGRRGRDRGLPGCQGGQNVPLDSTRCCGGGS